MSEVREKRDKPAYKKADAKSSDAVERNENEGDDCRGRRVTAAVKRIPDRNVAGNHQRENAE